MERGACAVFGPVSVVVFIGVVGVNRGRVRVVGGGADVEDKCVSVCGAVRWVADPERIVTSEVIGLGEGRQLGM